MLVRNRATTNAPEPNSQQRQLEFLPENHTLHGSQLRSQRHTQSNFLRALAHRVAHYPINSDGREQQRQVFQHGLILTRSPGRVATGCDSGYSLHLLLSTPEMAGTIAANSRLVKRGGERVHQKWLLPGEYRAEVQDEVVVLHAGDYRDSGGSAAKPPFKFRRGIARAGDSHNLTWKRSEEHTSELQSPCNLVCRLLLEKKKTHHVLLATRVATPDSRLLVRPQA